jgi:hypothetical protein
MKDRPDFSSEFQQVIAEWQKRHGLRENDAILLCVELFQIHQKHWDELRRQDLPSFSEFRDSLQKLQGIASSLQRDANSMVAELRLHKRNQTEAPPFVMILAVGLGCIALGFLLGRFTW